MCWRMQSEEMAVKIRLVILQVLRKACVFFFPVEFVMSTRKGKICKVKKAKQIYVLQIHKLMKT